MILVQGMSASGEVYPLGCFDTKKEAQQFCHAVEAEWKGLTQVKIHSLVLVTCLVPREGWAVNGEE